MSDAAVRVHPAVCTPNKERIMRRPLFVSTALLALVVGLSLVPSTLANSGSGGNYSVFPRVVATVIALAPQGLATIRTMDGATYEVVKCTTWRVGDMVTCEYTARWRTSWQALDCRKTS
jgi:hypothetical protein